MSQKRNENEDTMRHAFIPRCGGIRLLAALLPLCICLWLAGCGTKLPDSGSLPSVTVGEHTPFYLEVSTEDIQKKGLRTDGLAPAIEQQLLSVDGMKLADKPGPGTLAVRVDVRDIYLAGTTGKNYLKTAGTAIGSLIIGAVVGGVAGTLYSLDKAPCFTFIPGAVAGAVLGAGLGVIIGTDVSDPKEIWAMRAGVGMAWHVTPDTLEEIVVSSGPDGVASRKDTTGILEHELARRISEAITPLPSPGPK